MRALEFITGHVIYNQAYTYKFQLKTTKTIDVTAAEKLETMQDFYQQVVEMFTKKNPPKILPFFVAPENWWLDFVQYLNFILGIQMKGQL